MNTIESRMSGGRPADARLGTRLITASGIWKSLGGRLVLSNMSFELCEGERVVLLGANGCGKSTLLHILSGVLEPDEGQVEISAHAQRLGFRLGFAPEKPDLPEHLRVGEWLDVVASLKGLRHTRDRVDDDDVFGVKPLHHKLTKTLSLGQKQRVSLAAAWLGHHQLLRESDRDRDGESDRAHDRDRDADRGGGGDRDRGGVPDRDGVDASADVLVLDEPTNALDAETRERVMDHLATKTRTAVIATHDREVATRIATRVVTM